MKFLSLVLRRIRSYFVDNKMIFLLYFAGSVLAALLLIYTYGNFMSYKDREASNAQILRQYTVELSNPEKKINMQTLRESMEPFHLETLELQYVKVSENGQLFSIATELTDGKPAYKANSGRIAFTDAEIKQALPVMVAGYDNEDMHSKKTIQFEGNNYQVIGFSSHAATLIPYTTFQKHQYPVTTVLVMPKKILNIEENNDLIKKLSTFFPEAVIETPKNYYKFAQSSFIGGFINMLGMYIVAIVALLLLASYMLRRYDKENMVQRRVGCSRGKCVAVSVLSNMLTALAAAGLAVLIHASCYQSFFAKISINDKIAYYPIDYLMLTLLVVAVTTCACIPFCLRGLSRSVVGAKANT